MENQEENKMRPVQSQTVIFGLLALTAGVILLMKNFGLLDSRLYHIIFSWPMLIVAAGVLNLSGKSKMWGLILILVGGFFLGTRFLGLSYSFGQVFWPSLIIIVGLALIFNAGGFWKRHKYTKLSQHDDVLEDVAIFGGIDKSIHSDSFKGGEVIAVFGGSKINLTKATLAPGHNKLEIVTVFGGVTLIVPPDWNVKMEVVSILGGFSDKRQIGQIDQTRTLIIKGVAIFGGGELKSF